MPPICAGCAEILPSPCHAADSGARSQPQSAFSRCSKAAPTGALAEVMRRACTRPECTHAQRAVMARSVAPTRRLGRALEKPMGRASHIFFRVSHWLQSIGFLCAAFLEISIEVGELWRVATAMLSPPPSRLPRRVLPPPPLLANIASSIAALTYDDAVGHAVVFASHVTYFFCRFHTPTCADISCAQFILRPAQFAFLALSCCPCFIAQTRCHAARGRRCLGRHFIISAFYHAICTHSSYYRRPYGSRAPLRSAREFCTFIEKEKMPPPSRSR